MGLCLRATRIFTEQMLAAVQGEKEGKASILYHCRHYLKPSKFIIALDQAPDQIKLSLNGQQNERWDGRSPKIQFINKSKTK